MKLTTKDLMDRLSEIDELIDDRVFNKKTLKDIRDISLGLQGTTRIRATTLFGLLKNINDELTRAKKIIVDIEKMIELDVRRHEAIDADILHNAKK